LSLHFFAAERSGVENTKLSDYGPPKSVKHALDRQLSTCCTRTRLADLDEIWPQGSEANRVNDSITSQRLDAGANDTKSLKRYQSTVIRPHSHHSSVLGLSALEVTDGFVERPTAERILSSFGRGPALSCQILLIERLTYQRLDHRLPADVQLFGRPVKFFEHARRQVNIHPLYRTHHPPIIGEEP
jgi:hypothetical protein